MPPSENIKTESSNAASLNTKREFRSEIQGLRGLAIFLIVVYHIWVGKPSGGIDVFIMLSGFFMIGSLSKKISSSTRPKLIDFVSKLVKRLLPSALFVILAITFAMLVIMPSIFWQETLREVFASALYFENWQLVANSRNYLAAGNSVSPLQHFWSLSIQGQLYLLWFLIMAAAISVLKFLKLGRQRFLFLVVLGVFIASFVYANIQVEIDQGAAYFNTFARIWQFALGGLVAMLMVKIKLPSKLQLVFGWLGVIGIILCGIVLDTRSLFPGYAALWPTISAALILVNTESQKLNVNEILKTKPLVYLGNISYPLFLWHWPVLIFFLIQTEQSKAGFVGGMFIAIFSVLAADFTYRFIEGGLAKKKLFPLMEKRGTLKIATVVCVFVLLFPTAVFAYVSVKQNQSEIAIDDVNYPGARALVDGFVYEGDKNVEIVPNHFNVKNDVPSVYENDMACISDSRSLKVIKCEYGKRSAEKVVALVGGSYSAHWLPAIQEIIKVDPDLRVVTYLKSSCPLSLGFEKPSTRNTCEKWNLKIISELEELKPDLIISTSTRSGYSDGDDEEVPESYKKAWDVLEQKGLNVFALRDVPRRRYNLGECVAKNGYSSKKCESKKSDSLSAVDPTIEISSDHENVYFSDLTEFICKFETCVPVVGNVLVHRDHAHMTATYSRTLYPMIQSELDVAIKKFSISK